MKLAMFALGLLAGCGHVSLDRVVTAHNIFRQVLITASDSYAVLYGENAAARMGESESDYAAAMKPYDAVVSAMRGCQTAERLLHDALEQCVAANDERCDVAKTGLACAAAALDTLSDSYGQIRGGASLYAAAAIAKAELLTLADGASCPTPKP